jgi:hypothetical protein
MGLELFYHEDEGSRFFRKVGTFLHGVTSQKTVIIITAVRISGGVSTVLANERNIEASLVGWKPRSFGSVDGNSPRQHRNENTAAYSSRKRLKSGNSSAYSVIFIIFFCSHSFEISY